MTTRIVRFSKPFLAKIPLSSNAKPNFFADRLVRGLKLKVSRTRKTFLLEKRIRGRKGSAVTFKLGAFPNLPLEDARNMARHYLSLCERGLDPRVIDRPDQKKRQRVTLAAAVDAFFEVKNQIAPRTRRDYRSVLRNHLNDWMSKDLCTVTPEDIAAKYLKIANHSLKQGRGTMKVLSSIWNTVTFQFLGSNKKRLLPTNPIPEGIRLVGGYRRSKPKRTVIPLHKLGAWVDLVETMRTDPATPTGKRRTLGCLLASLFLGLRHQEARTLRWDGVDLETGILTIEAGIAKNRRQHIIPLPGYVRDLLREITARRNPANPYVFPSPWRKAKAYRPIGRNCRTSNEISARLGIEFSPHATRRTFASVANHLRIPFLTLKRLMNHHFQGGVTGGYIIPAFNPSENREEIEKIARFYVAQRDAYVSKKTG